MEEGQAREEMHVMSIRENLLKDLQLMAEPINFADLIARGILAKKANGWYQILRRDLLPVNAWAQTTAVKSGWMVKFSRSAHRPKKLQKT